MAPIRRYLRITKYSVLELRIYLDNPALSETWLLRRNDPALPRVIGAIRPYVLPKLREENERTKKAGSKKKKGSVKSEVKQDDFEVSFFLIHQSTPHSVLTKQKDFTEKPRLKSNSSKLTSWLQAGGSSDVPISVESSEGTGRERITIREENDDDINMADIPEAPANPEGEREEEDDDDELFINDSDSSDTFEPLPRRRPKKSSHQQQPAALEAAATAADNKKKLVLATHYEGFSIYGDILCLIIKRVGPGTPRAKASSSQQMMENWVSTQVEREEEGLVPLVD